MYISIYLYTNVYVRIHEFEKFCFYMLIYKNICIDSELSCPNKKIITRKSVPRVKALVS